MPRGKPERSASFEQVYAQLEDHVARLERGGLSLEEAIEIYEAGMKLARECQQRLDDAELRITKLRESFSATPDVAEPDGGVPGEYEYVGLEGESGDDEPDD